MPQELPPTPPEPAHHGRRRRSWRLAVAVTGVALGIALSLASWWQFEHPGVGHRDTSHSAVIGELYRGALPPGVGAGASTDPAVYWISGASAGAGADAFVVTTFGSSGCPWARTRMTADADAQLTIRMTMQGGPACSADLGSTSYALTMPAGLRGAPRVGVTLTFDGHPAVRRELLRD